MTGIKKEKKKKYGDGVQLSFDILAQGLDDHSCLSKESNMLLIWLNG